MPGKRRSGATSRGRAKSVTPLAVSRRAIKQESRDVTPSGTFSDVASDISGDLVRRSPRMTVQRALFRQPATPATPRGRSVRGGKGGPATTASSSTAPASATTTKRKRATTTSPDMWDRFKASSRSVSVPAAMVKEEVVEEEHRQQIPKAKVSKAPSKNRRTSTERASSESAVARKKVARKTTSTPRKQRKALMDKPEAQSSSTETQGQVDNAVMARLMTLESALDEAIFEVNDRFSKVHERINQLEQTTKELKVAIENQNKLIEKNTDWVMNELENITMDRPLAYWKRTSTPNDKNVQTIPENAEATTQTDTVADCRPAVEFSPANTIVIVDAAASKDSDQLVAEDGEPLLPPLEAVPAGSVAPEHVAPEEDDSPVPTSMVVDFELDDMEYPPFVSSPVLANTLKQVMDDMLNRVATEVSGLHKDEPQPIDMEVQESEQAEKQPEVEEGDVSLSTEVMEAEETKPAEGERPESADTPTSEEVLQKRYSEETVFVEAEQAPVPDQLERTKLAADCADANSDMAEQEAEEKKLDERSCEGDLNQWENITGANLELNRTHRGSHGSIDDEEMSLQAAIYTVIHSKAPEKPMDLMEDSAAAPESRNATAMCGTLDQEETSVNEDALAGATEEPTNDAETTGDGAVTTSNQDMPNFDEDAEDVLTAMLYEDYLTFSSASEHSLLDDDEAEKTVQVETIEVAEDSSSGCRDLELIIQHLVEDPTEDAEHCSEDLVPEAEDKEDSEADDHLKEDDESVSPTFECSEVTPETALLKIKFEPDDMCLEEFEDEQKPNPRIVSYSSSDEESSLETDRRLIMPKMEPHSPESSPQRNEGSMNMASVSMRDQLIERSVSPPPSKKRKECNARQINRNEICKDAQMRSRSPEIVAQVYPDLEAASNKVSEASPATTPERPFDFSMVMPGSIDPQIQTPEYVEDSSPVAVKQTTPNEDISESMREEGELYDSDIDVKSERDDDMMDIVAESDREIETISASQLDAVCSSDLATLTISSQGDINGNMVASQAQAVWEASNTFGAADEQEEYKPPDAPQCSTMMEENRFESGDDWIPQDLMDIVLDPLPPIPTQPVYPVESIKPVVPQPEPMRVDDSDPESVARMYALEFGRVSSLTVVVTLRRILHCNLVRWKKVFATTLIKAQQERPSATAVYATILSVLTRHSRTLGEMTLSMLWQAILENIETFDKRPGTLGPLLSFVAALMHQNVVRCNVMPKILGQLLTFKSSSPDSRFTMACQFVVAVGSKATENGDKSLSAALGILRRFHMNPQSSCLSAASVTAYKKEITDGQKLMAKRDRIPIDLSRFNEIRNITPLSLDAKFPEKNSANDMILNVDDIPAICDMAFEIMKDAILMDLKLVPALPIRASLGAQPPTPFLLRLQEELKECPPEFCEKPSVLELLCAVQQQRPENAIVLALVTALENETFQECHSRLVFEFACSIRNFSSHLEKLFRQIYTTADRATRKELHGLAATMAFLLQKRWMPWMALNVINFDGYTESQNYFVIQVINQFRYFCQSEEEYLELLRNEMLTSLTAYMSMSRQQMMGSEAATWNSEFFDGTPVALLLKCQSPMTKRNAAP